ncbi:MAG: hypothetical protein AAFY88_21235, partial [Acidobacteriota bacterium]
MAGLASAAGAVALTDEAAARLREARVDVTDVVAPMALSTDMQAWAEERVQRGAPDEVRLKRLLRELYEAEDRNFLYQEGHTATVAETFRTGRYNCLSFSMLYVALARSLGLEAFYLSIKRDQDFRRVGDLVVLTRHITAGYGSNFVDRTILEFDIGPDVDYAAAEPINDTKALALYYSNRGAELLREEDLDAAEENLRIAQLWAISGAKRRAMRRFSSAASRS